MNRRDTLKTILAATGTLAISPSWAMHWKKEGLGHFASVFDIEDSKLLTAIVDTIIPKGNSIGAIDVGVEKYLIKLISDCYPLEVQKNVTLQLKELNILANNLHSKSFVNCSQNQREGLLLSLEKGSDDQRSFFALVKSQTIRGYNTCEEIMVNHLGYVMAPGFYNGCTEI